MVLLPKQQPIPLSSTSFPEAAGHFFSSQLTLHCKPSTQQNTKLLRISTTRSASASLGTARPRWALLGPAHFMLRFHYSLGTGVVTIVTQCRRSRDVIFNENPRKTTQPLAVSTQSSQLLIYVQKLDKS